MCMCIFIWKWHIRVKLTKILSKKKTQNTTFCLKVSKNRNNTNSKLLTEFIYLITCFSSRKLNSGLLPKLMWYTTTSLDGAFRLQYMWVFLCRLSDLISSVELSGFFCLFIFKPLISVNTYKFHDIVFFCELNNQHYYFIIIIIQVSWYGVVTVTEITVCPWTSVLFTSHLFRTEYSRIH